MLNNVHGTAVSSKARVAAQS